MLTSLLQCSYIHPVRLNVYIVTQFQRRGFLEYSGPHRDPCCVSQKSVNLFKSRNHDLNSGTSSRPTSQPARYLTWLSEAPSPLADPLDSPPSIDEGQSPDGCVRSLAPRSSSGPAQHTEVTPRYATTTSKSPPSLGSAGARCVARCGTGYTCSAYTKRRGSACQGCTSTSVLADLL